MTTRTTKCKNWRRQCGHYCSQPPKKWPISRPRACARGYTLTPLRGWDGRIVKDTRFLQTSKRVEDKEVPCARASDLAVFSESTSDYIIVGSSSHSCCSFHGQGTFK